MGCGASRPADEDEPPSASGPASHTYLGPSASSTRAISSTSAIIGSTPSVHARPLQPSSLASRGTASRSNISTPRHSSATRPVALHEHYNVPLQLPPPWRSTNRAWTYSQLERERSEFFETRVTGRQEIWGALKNVCELLRQGELATAQGILEAAAVTTPTGSLIEGCYDEAGNLYRLPETMILDPTNIIPDETTRRADRTSNIDGDTMIGVREAKAAAINSGQSVDFEKEEEDSQAIERRRDEKGKGTERDAVKVRCRLSDRGGPDVIVLLGKSQTVGTLARRVQSEADVAKTARIRMAYLGKMLNERETLAVQGWKEGHVLNALVAGLPPGAT